MTDSQNTMSLRGFPPWCVAQSTNIKEMKHVARKSQPPRHPGRRSIRACACIAGTCITRPPERVSVELINQWRGL